MFSTLKNVIKKIEDNYLVNKKTLIDEQKFVLDIIVNEIYEKTVFDIKFQNIYIETIKNIWSDKSFYKNFF